jgi:hypothetical protein
MTMASENQDRLEPPGGAGQVSVTADRAEALAERPLRVDTFAHWDQLDAIDSSPTGTVFRISALCLSRGDARAVAEGLLTVVAKRMVAAGAPADLYVEIDRHQVTEVPPGHTTRRLLPHHDGGHCSFLSPSRKDLPDWPVEHRICSTAGFATTHAHKLLQGFFIEEAGARDASTPYYDWRAILRDAYRYQGGQPSPATEPTRLAAWLGDNITYSASIRHIHHCGYLSIPAALGARPAVYHLTPPGPRAESDFAPEAYEWFPELHELTRDCACGSCEGEGGRHFCNGLKLTTGLSWPEFQRTYEERVISSKFDLVVGNNLTLLHAGMGGSAERLIQPMCVVIDHPAGEEYEAWLWRLWRL